MFAQKGKMARANRFFKTMNYQEAIEAYLEILDKSDNNDAKMNLAECYRKVDNMADAEYWFGQVVRLPDAKPIQKLYYGMALQANGKCDQAKQWFEEYTSLVPDDLRGRLLKESCDEVMVDRLLKAGALYKVTNIAKMNTGYDDFGATYFDKGIVFSSERDRGVAIKRIHSWTGHPFLELFYAPAQLIDEETMEYKYGESDKYSSKINSKFHDGPVSFSKDYKEIFFTRNNVVGSKVGKDDDGIVRLKVYNSKRTGDTWGDLESLPFNSDEYSVAHPALSADGTKLYFSSDMPGGFGGMDLYVAYLENGRWSPPINLGPTVNTEGNEVFPFIHEDGTLYFASDGHTGLGGLDLFYSVDNGGAFSVPVNVGYPVNTSSDDFSLILNPEKTHGYFSSNRSGGSGGDDIYSFTKFAVNVKVLVFDKSSGDPIEGSVVTTGYDVIPNLTTGADGTASLQLPINVALDFKAEKESFEDNAVAVNTKSYKPGETILIQIPLTRPIVISVVGNVKDELTGKPLVGAAVQLESNCGQETQYTTTDGNGRYEFVLRPNCCYIVKVIQNGYITKTDNFCTDVIDPLNPVFRRDVPLVPTEVVPAVAPIKLEHIYYNFDKWAIRDDATPSMEELLQLLKDNPQVIVEIGSHTDSRGAAKYNERLSSRRAESVVKYLISKGIAKERLQSKGYGESVHVNNCYDKVPCTEEQHQLNRRTEFKVVGTLKTGSKVDQTSTAPAKITTDPCKKCPF